MVRRLGMIFVFFAGISAGAITVAAPVDSAVCIKRCTERGLSVGDCKYICTGT